MILILVTFYVCVGSALATVPVSLVQGAKLGRSEATAGRSLLLTGAVTFGVPAVLLLFGAYIAFDVYSLTSVWTDFVMIWMMMFGMSMVIMVPLSLAGFGLAYMVKRSWA